MLKNGRGLRLSLGCVGGNDVGKLFPAALARVSLRRTEHNPSLRGQDTSVQQAAVTATAAAVSCHWARSACRQESSAATIFFNFPQQSSVDNKLMRARVTKVLFLLLLQLNYARPQQKWHSSSFMLAEWYITHTSCAPSYRNSCLDEPKGDGEKSRKETCNFYFASIF